MAEFKLKQTAEEVQKAVDNALLFGEFPTGGDTLYWDGNTEGLVSAEGLYYKVSDRVLTADDFVNGFIVAVSSVEDGSVLETLDIPLDKILDVGDGFLFSDVFAVVPNDNYEFEGLLFPEAGVYILRDLDEGYCFAPLTIPGYTGFPVTKKIEQKYLPGAVILYTDGKYLYATEDTSDASKRMTKLELLKTINSGRAVYLTIIDGDSTQLKTLSNSGITPEFVVAVFGDVSAFTAEYVTES